MKRLAKTIAALMLVALAWHGASVLLRSPKERAFRAALGGIDLINDPLQEKLYRRVCDVARSVSDGPGLGDTAEYVVRTVPPLSGRQIDCSVCGLVITKNARRVLFGDVGMRLSPWRPPQTLVFEDTPSRVYRPPCDRSSLIQLCIVEEVPRSVPERMLVESHLREVNVGLVSITIQALHHYDYGSYRGSYFLPPAVMHAIIPDGGSVCHPNSLIEKGAR